MTQPGKDRAADIHGVDMVRARIRAGLTLAVALLLTAISRPVRAEPLPLPPREQAKVNQAMLQGMIFLKNTQGIDGCWTPPEKPHRVGYAALPAMTLLECGMPANHSVVQKAASFVGVSIPKEGNTYDLALAILFLDRLADSNTDVLQAVLQKRRIEEIIQVLAYRLVAGQTATGGWTYSCPVLSVRQHEQLKKALEADRIDRSTLAAWLKRLPVLQDPAKLMAKAPPDTKKTKKKQAQPETPKDDEADNSNTQFAALALWVSQRHGVPVERTFKLVGKRFRTSQNPDGGWGYKYQLGGGKPTSASMTCTGLVGLALERGLTPPQEIAGMSLNSQAATRIAALAGSPCLLNGFNAARIVDQAMARDAEKKKRMEEPVTLKALQALSNSVGQPTGKMENIPIGDLYFLWGLERVAMIYDFETIGGKDWYRWGAEMLLANLKPEGYWDVKTFGDAATEVINSSFALLFLRQANLAEDLTSKLREDPTVLDRPVVKKEAPAEARTAAAPTPPPAPPEAKKDPEKTGLASLANPKGAAAPESVEKATAKPPPSTSPQQPAPATPPTAAASPPASSTPPAARESNKLLLIGGGALGILLIGAASVLVVIGMRQNKGGIEEAESRRPRARKRPEAGNPKNGENRRPKTRKKEET